jgi:methyltransferase (TIGR00027 family)
MVRNAAAQTAFGPMVLAGVEQNEAPKRRLVQDDLARAFLPAGLRLLVDATRPSLIRRLFIAGSERTGPGLWTSLACRKRFIDAKLEEALADIDAVVVLGAGLDTRAYRLARRSDLPVFEVDQAINIERKKAAVQSAIGSVPSSVHLVPLDFERDDLATELADNGYRNGCRTFFIWEGVTQYLTADGVGGTFEFLRRCARGSRLVFTYVRRDFIDGTNLYGSRTLYRNTRGQPPLWHFGLNPDEVAQFISDYGWRLVEQAGPDYYLRHYIEPTGRKLSASQLEWTAYAEKD